MGKKQPELYRIPRKPGYLGGYNWRATTLGCLLLLVVNFIATQYIAARFHYQPALGEPILRARSGGIYQPFSWIAWGWRYCTSQDERIRRPFFEGEMIVFAGSILCVGIFFVLAGHRARKLTENAEDLHGSARWANEEDVRDTGLLATKHGVYVGGWCREGGHRLSYLRHNGPEHVLAFAPTRSGKGVGLVIPSLLAWGESAVIYDIKGENWAKTAGFRSRQGHLCFKFSPVEEQASSRFNPLSEVRLFTPRDVSDAQNIANMIVRTGEDSPQERYWQDAAASITTGMILHVCYESALEGRVACLADLSHGFTRPGSGFRETLDELLNFEQSWTCSRLAYADRRSDTHPSRRSRESAGNARQGGPRLRRRPFNSENCTHALQRSSRGEEHFGQRLYH
jgi:type IV secretion system protein VirD4